MLQILIQQISQISSAIIATGILSAFFFLPMLAFGWWLQRARQRSKAELLEPFTTLPLRPPGESLRLKIDDLREKFDEYVLQLLFTCMFGAFVAAIPGRFNAWVFAVAVVIVLITFAAIAPRVVRLMNQLRDYRLGFMGERVVGEELNQLLGAGFHVFHDVPFDQFNLDHVLVGPPGVFVVETKAKSKDARIPGRTRATVYSDGTVLKFPNWTDREFLQQTRLGATSLAEWLTRATGERVTVNGILTLPGWRIERTGRGDVNVLRPDEIKRSFPASPKTPLPPDQIRRIAHQLTERCRLVKA